MKLIRLNSFLYLFCILSVFASCVQKPDSSVEDWNRTFINTKKLISEACLDRELILGRPFLIQYVDSSLLIYPSGSPEGLIYFLSSCFIKF